MDTPLTVGFDLDMTLVDSRPGIAACYRALTEQTGVYVDADLAVRRLGPPLRIELAEWFPSDEIETAVDAYRALYPVYAITCSPALPGAVQAVAAVPSGWGRVVLVTSEPTGPCTVDDLWAADADAVLSGLRGFPEWLDGLGLGDCGEMASLEGRV